MIYIVLGRNNKKLTAFYQAFFGFFYTTHIRVSKFNLFSVAERAF
jgi:hypothetical protein